MDMPNVYPNIAENWDMSKVYVNHSIAPQADQDRRLEEALKCPIVKVGYYTYQRIYPER